MCMRYVIICGLHCSNTFQQNLVNSTIFEKRKEVTEHKVWILILSTSVWNIAHSKNKWARNDKKCMLGFL
jgi:phosphate/sulfate permease